MSIEQKIIKLQKIFIERSWTLAIAESCTGGRLSAEFTGLPGSSKYFLGTVVSYHPQVKNKLLNVPMSIIQVLGEVSEPVALAMAVGVRAGMSSTWSIAITGIAGPSGGTVDKPVGTVCFAASGPNGNFSLTKNFGPLGREEIQKKSVEFAVDYLFQSFS